MVNKGTLRQLFGGFVTSLTFFITGTSIGWVAPVLSKIRDHDEPFSMTTAEQTWLVSLSHFGACLSPFLCGFLMNRFGRKRLLIFLTGCPIAAWFLIYWAANMSMLYCGRVCLGIWAGGCFTIVPIYNAEIAGPCIRGVLGTFIPLAVFSGILFDFCIGPVISYSSLAMINGTLPVGFLFFCLLIPESPYWLLMTGKRQKAENAIRWLRAYGNDSDTLAEISKLETEINKEMELPGGYKHLFLDSAHRWPLFLVLALTFFQRTCGILAQEAFLPVTLPSEGAWFLSVHNCTIFLGVEWVLSIFLSIFLIYNFERRLLLKISSAGCCLSMGVSGTWFLLRQESPKSAVSSYTWFPFITFVVFGIFYAVGLGPIIGSFYGEIFSTNVKAQGSTVACVFGAFVGFVANKQYLIITETWGLHWNFFGFCTSLLLCFIFSSTLMVETKRKTLFEIHQESLATQNVNEKPPNTK